MPGKIDEVVDEVGAFGKYQLVQVCVSSLGTFAASLHTIIAVFHSIVPEFRCKIPGVDNDSYTNGLYNSTLDYWIPRDSETGVYDSCMIFNRDISANSANFTVDYMNITGVGQWYPTVKCTEYVYSKEVYWGTTLTEQFDLVCDRRGYLTAAKVAFTAGMMVGAPIVGSLGDVFGRRIVLIVFMFAGATLGTIATFSYNFIMYTVFRFFIALCFVELAGLSNCITLEITGPSKRPLAIAIRMIFWPAAQCLLSFLAYYIQDWNWLQLACSLPVFAGGLLQVLILKETPHFLMRKNRQAEAIKTFQEMAEANGKDVPECLLNTKNSFFDLPRKREKLRKVLKAPVLLKRTAVFIYLWFVAGIGKLGLNYHVNNLTGSIYLNNLVSGLVEIPVFIATLLSHYIGRKVLVIFCLLLGSFSLVAAALMHVYLDLEAYSSALTIVVSIGKSAISGVLAFDYFWSSEVFPSVLRASLTGLGSMFARIGSLISPLIVDLHLFWDTPFNSGLGPLIFGITMAIGSAMALYPPETNNQKIPETIEEANEFMVRPSRSNHSNTKSLEPEENDTELEQVNEAYEA